MKQVVNQQVSINAQLRRVFDRVLEQPVLRDTVVLAVIPHVRIYVEFFLDSGRTTAAVCWTFTAAPPLTTVCVQQVFDRAIEQDQYLRQLEQRKEELVALRQELMK